MFEYNLRCFVIIKCPTKEKENRVSVSIVATRQMPSRQSKKATNGVVLAATTHKEKEKRVSFSFSQAPVPFKPDPTATQGITTPR